MSYHRLNWRVTDDANLTEKAMAEGVTASREPGQEWLRRGFGNPMATVNQALLALVAIIALAAPSTGCSKRATLVHRPWLVRANCPGDEKGIEEQMNALTEVMEGLRKDCLKLPPDLQGRVGIKAKFMDPSKPPANGEPFVQIRSRAGTLIPYIRGEINALAKDMDALDRYQACVQDSIAETAKRMGCRIEPEPNDDWTETVELE